MSPTIYEQTTKSNYQTKWERDGVARKKKSIRQPVNFSILPQRWQHLAAISLVGGNVDGRIFFSPFTLVAD